MTMASLEMASESDGVVGQGERGRAGWIVYALLFSGAVVMVYPLVWMVLSSFNSNEEIFSNSAALPSHFSLDNYVQGWTSTNPSFTRYFINSFVICLGAVTGNVLACSLTAFAFARLRFPLKGALFTIMLLTLMLPSHRSEEHTSELQSR